MGTKKFDYFFQKSSKFEFWVLTKCWNHFSFVNISPILVIDTSVEWSSQILHHGNPKIWFFFQESSKFEFWLLTKNWNHLSFVNISPTLVIDTSMEWSSRVLHHGNPEMWIFFQKVRNWQNWILSVPRVSVRREKKTPWLRQYQSYIGYWYVNGKVFSSTTPWKPKNLNFQKSSKFEFWLLTKNWNHLSFVNISPTLVIDTSMERSSRVLQHENPKIWIFFFKFQIDEIEFCPYAEKRNRPGFVNISPT